MKISRLHVDGFGVWNRLGLDGLGQPILVFYGENETGKTTLMQFVRGMLYGFSHDQRARYLPLVKEGRAGGALVLEDDGRQFTLSRHALVDPPRDELELVDAAGTRRELRVLASLLEGVDETVFQNVFAFGLGEIQELATLSDSAAADLLYELTLGIDRVSLAEVVGNLQRERRALLADPDSQDQAGQGTRGQISELFHRLADLRDQAAALAEGTGHFLELIKQQTDLDQTATRLTKEETALDQRLRLLALSSQVEPRWREHRQVEKQLAAMGTIAPLLEDCLTRLDGLNIRRQTRRKRLDSLSRRRQELVTEIDRLGINEALCRHAPRLEALAEQQHWIGALESQSRDLEKELADLAASGPAASGPVATSKPGGTKPSEPTVIALPKTLTPQTIAQIRVQGKSLSELRRRVRQAAGELDKVRESSTSQRQKIDAALGGTGSAPLGEAVSKAGEQVSLLRRRVQIDEKFDQLERRRKDLEERTDTSVERQVLAPWQLAVLGCVFVPCVALVLAAIFLSDLAGKAPLAMLGLTGIGLSVFAKFGLERMAGTQLEDCERLLSQLEEQVAKLTAERDALDAKLPRGGGPLVSRLQTAEKELSRLEELLPLDADQQQMSRTLNEARAQRKTTLAEFHKARQAWRRALLQAGLPETLTLRQLRASLAAAQEQEALERRITATRDRLTDAQRQHELLAERIMQVALDARLDLAEVEPLPLLREMLRRLEDERLRLATREKLRGRLTKLRRLRRKSLRQLKAVASKHAELIRACGARDEDDVRRLAARRDEARRLERERVALAEEIAAALADCEQVETISDYLETGANLRKLSDEAQAAKQKLRTQLGEVWQQRGALAEQIKAQVNDRRQAETRAELAATQKTYEQAIERWRTVCVCLEALDSVRKQYERQRQPEVLREASGYLASLTGGRYARLWTPLGERSLRVDDTQGRPLSIEVLSRGTREQIFLALRLALVSALARRGVRLPVVMDDVLVNFDATRAKAAVGVLRDFAREGHQLLVFTCHEHLAREFRRARVEVRALPGNELAADEPPASAPPLVVSPPMRVVPKPHFLPEPAEISLPPEETDEELLTLADEPEPPRPEPRLWVHEVVVEPEAAIPAPVAVAKPARSPRVSKPRRTKPVVAAAPRQRLRHEQWVDRVPWSAEEFDGELADRVRRETPIVEEVEVRPAPAVRSEGKEFEDEEPEY